VATGCSTDNGPGRYLRRASVEHVLTEIDTVRRKYPLEFVHFTGRTCSTSTAPGRSSFLREYKRSVKAPLLGDLHDRLGRKPDLLALYKEAGCVNIRIAFETASDDLKKELERPKESPHRKSVGGGAADQRHGHSPHDAQHGRDSGRVAGERARHPADESLGQNRIRCW
jgi:radical SAM superfamily enzyme YgiQ (UPF0313 family)